MTAPLRSGLRSSIRLIGLIVVCGAALLSLAVVGLAATNTLRLVPVLSNSMAPMMPTGSLAITVPVQRADVRAGDVIVFSDPLQPSIRVIHRVTKVFGAPDAFRFSNWSVDKSFLTTKGDNNAAADPWVVTIADPTVWRRTDSLPGLGYLAIWFSNPALRLSVFVLAGVAIALWGLLKIWRRPPVDNTEAAEPPRSVESSEELVIRT